MQLPRKTAEVATNRSARPKNNEHRTETETEIEPKSRDLALD